MVKYHHAQLKVTGAYEKSEYLDTQDRRGPPPMALLSIQRIKLFGKFPSEPI